MVTAHQITEWQKQRKIKQLIWDMACSASELNVSPYMTKEYEELIGDFNWRFTEYKLFSEWVTTASKEEQIMFTFMIYYSLP
jgi:hypothetical protein